MKDKELFWFALGIFGLAFSIVLIVFMFFFLIMALL